jgi:DNA-directed RNA polymerase subunit F
MLLYCIELIFKFQNTKIDSIRSKINNLKIFVLDLDFFKNLLLVSVTQGQETEEDYICLTQTQARQILKKGNFYRTIKHVSEQIVYVNEEHVEWAVKFLEKFFEIEPEIFTDYLEKFKSIIDKSNEVVLRCVNC